MGFNDLEKVDILKFATMIRDPVTKETVIPFETRHTKTDEMKNLAWEKIHQEAFGHFQNKNLKLTDMSQNSLIQNDIIPSTVNGQYDISPDREYIKINYSDSSVKLCLSQIYSHETCNSEEYKDIYGWKENHDA